MSQDKTKHLLNDLLKTNRLVNGYIFYGNNALTLRQAAFYTALSFFNPTHSNKVSTESIQNNPDLIYFRPETATIKIADIQDIQDRIKYGPAVYKRLFVIIDQADLLTNQAANAFLKTLEEPIDNVSFILLTTTFNQLLPTIRSRCQHLYIQNSQSFPITLPFDEETNVDIDIISFKQFLSLDKLTQFNHIEAVAKDKVQTKKQVDCWIETHFEHGDHSFIEVLLDIRNRLEFNVNVRLQLEQLIL